MFYSYLCISVTSIFVVVLRCTKMYVLNFKQSDQIGKIRF